jgi:DNA-binding transcriptional regulator YiaG
MTDTITITAAQFVDMLDRLGLSQPAAAHFLDIDERKIRRWSKPDSGSEVPQAVALLLALMVGRRITPEVATALAHMMFPTTTERTDP